MITLHGHVHSFLTFTIEWWGDGPYWVQMFLPNGSNWRLDRCTSTYEQAMKEGLLVCQQADEYFSRDPSLPHPNDSLYEHLIGGESGAE